MQLCWIPQLKPKFIDLWVLHYQWRYIWYISFCTFIHSFTILFKKFCPSGKNIDLAERFFNNIWILTVCFFYFVFICNLLYFISKMIKRIAFVQIYPKTFNNYMNLTLKTENQEMNHLNYSSAVSRSWIYLYLGEKIVMIDKGVPEICSFQSDGIKNFCPNVEWISWFCTLYQCVWNNFRIDLPP